MSSFHDALYTSLPTARAAIFSRLNPILQGHGIRFLNSARGLRRDREKKEFVPDIEQELDDLADLPEAILATAEWNCVCLDVRWLQWEFELYFYDSPGQDRSTTNVFLSFPHSLYKAAVRDPNGAARWIGLLATSVWPWTAPR